jgi:hypothetical protein
LENDFYKVRIPGFGEISEAKKILPDLAIYGFPETFFVSTPCVTIQVGAFNIQANAVDFQFLIASTFGKPVILVFEEGFYKVRITGFSNSEDAAKFLPMVTSRGFSDAFIHSSE